MAALFVNLSWSYAAIYIFDNNLTFLTFEIPADTRPKDGKSAILTKVCRAKAGQHRMTSKYYIMGGVKWGRYTKLTVPHQLELKGGSKSLLEKECF